MISRFSSILMVAFFLVVTGTELLAQEKTYVKKVVIDAGHGGKDPGAVGRKVQEKDIALSIALKVGKRIRENCPDVKVIYTRENDTFVELYQRASIANRNQADLFLSIHCNANRSRTFQGSETYVMGLHKTMQNLEISKLENAAILMEPDYLINYDGFDPSSDESYITFTLFQNAYLNQSLEFASLVQKELKNNVGMEDRGVRQAGFLVLYKTTMPSVLIETGFLSNSAEENFLLSKSGQDRIADAIANAFIRYKSSVEKSNLSEGKSEQPPSLTKEDQASKPPNSSPNAINQKTEKTTLENKNTTPSVGTSVEVTFSVQVAVYPTEIGVKNKKFSGLSEVRYYKQDNKYKYIVGSESSLEDANRILEKVKKKGFKDAFVVAFHGKERITIKEARLILEKQNNK